MKRKLFMKRSQSRAGSGFARVITIVVLLAIAAAAAGPAWGQNSTTYNVTFGGFSNQYMNITVSVASLPQTFTEIDNYDFYPWQVLSDGAEFTSVSVSGGEGKVSANRPDWSRITITVTGTFEGTATIHVTGIDNNEVPLSCDITVSCVAPPQPHTVSLKEGTEDAGKWTIEPTEAKPNTEIKATYNGEKKVKSVKAVKKGDAAPEKTYYYGDGYYTVDGGSGGFSGEQHGNLVDNNLNNKWCQNKPDGGWYIEFHTASAIQVNGYMLRTGNDTQGQSNRNPTDWVLKGKNEGDSDWTVIDTKSNNNDMPNANYTNVDFDVNVPGEYQYFRLEISNNRGNGGVMQLSEMRLFKYVTWNATTKQATFTMPDGDVELEVEYYAESNLYLSKDALADKTSIAVKAGELGVQFGEDGKSANTITEGTAMTVKYNGTKKVIGVKVEKKAAFKMAATATAEDVGKVVCAAGHLHDAKTAVPTGCTAVGILGKVTETGHGLILALNNASSQTWNTINGWTSVTTYASTTLKQLPDDAARGANLTSYTTLGSTTVSNWCVAQKSDYEAIFTNLGSTAGNEGGRGYDANVNAYITTGVGGTAMSGYYWSASKDEDGWGWLFWDPYWNGGVKDNPQSLRPVLGF